MMRDGQTVAGRDSRDLSLGQATREERHQLLATLLGAYADGELPSETASQIDAHLLGCTRCRRELEVQSALRHALDTMPRVHASSALRERVIALIAAAPHVVLPAAPSRVQSAMRSPRTRVAMTALTVCVVVAAALIWQRDAAVGAAASAPTTMVSLPSVDLFSAVLVDYRRVTSTDLPGRARDLASVRAALPFPVEPLTSAQLRLLAVWTTDLRGEPAAVLAYRWRDQLVVQYVVSEQVLFRPSAVRRVFAAGHPLGAVDGAQGLLAWPARESGEFLIGEATPSQLASLRERASRR